MIKQIRIFSFTVILILCNYGVFAQTKWKNREDTLYGVWLLEDISYPNYTSRYIKYLKESGSLGFELQAWFKQRDTIDNFFLQTLKIKKGNNLTLYIPDSFNFLNGNENIKVYLLNFSNETIYVPRIDATLDSISEYIRVHGEWLQLRKNHLSISGNSYYKKSMAPNESNLYELRNCINQEKGTEILKYKLVFNYLGKEIESNEIEIKLFSSQLKRFLEEGMEIRY
jgi:hypothetical protein